MKKKISYDDHIFIAGSTGMAGGAIKKKLEKNALNMDHF